jgi:hypothetical protein
MLSPTIATNVASLCFSAFSVYYLTAAVFLARSSVPELKMMPINFSTAISAVPAGLVRKRGMLFIIALVLLCFAYADLWAFPVVLKAHPQLVRKTNLVSLR